jgi:hypothetical protein
MDMDDAAKEGSVYNATAVKSLHRRLDRDFAAVALPAFVSLAADPIASMVDAIYVARLGPVEQAAMGIAISAQFSIAKLYNDPLLKTSTSLVAASSSSSSHSHIIIANHHPNHHHNHHLKHHHHHHHHLHHTLQLLHRSMKCGHFPSIAVHNMLQLSTIRFRHDHSDDSGISNHINSHNVSFRHRHRGRGGVSGSRVLYRRADDAVGVWSITS